MIASSHLIGSLPAPRSRLYHPSTALDGEVGWTGTIRSPASITPTAKSGFAIETNVSAKVSGSGFLRLACTAYVDLKPFRAGMVDWLDDPDAQFSVGERFDGQDCLPNALAGCEVLLWHLFYREKLSWHVTATPRSDGGMRLGQKKQSNTLPIGYANSGLLAK